MRRRLLAVLILGGSLVLAGCGTSAATGSSTSSTPGTSSGKDNRLFTNSGTWVVPQNGVYMVIAVAGGGGGGGGGSALSSGGISDQVGGAGGAAGAVTINDTVGRVGQRVAVEVGKGGTPGAGGAINGGTGGAAGSVASPAAPGWPPPTVALVVPGRRGTVMQRFSTPSEPVTPAMALGGLPVLAAEPAPPGGRYRVPPTSIPGREAEAAEPPRPPEVGAGEGQPGRVEPIHLVAVSETCQGPAVAPVPPTASSPVEPEAVAVVGARPAGPEATVGPGLEDSWPSSSWAL